MSMIFGIDRETGSCFYVCVYVCEHDGMESRTLRGVVVCAIVYVCMYVYRHEEEVANEARPQTLLFVR